MKCYLQHLVLFFMALTMPSNVTAEEIPTAPVVNTVTMDFSSPNREYVYLLSSGYTSKRAEFGEMLYETVTTAPAKDVIHFFEADEYQHKHIFTVEVPDVDDELLRDVDYPMQRAQAEAVNILEYQPPEQPQQLSRAEAIDRQQVSLQRLGATVKSVRQTTFPLCVVIAGTPIFNGEKVHRGFSMELGTVPGLATLRQDQQHISPFSDDGVVDLPGNTLVTILSDTGWGIDHIHEKKCEKFWRRFLRERGGAHLTRITDSVVSAFRVREAQIVPPDAATQTETQLDVEFGNFHSTMPSVLDLEGGVPTIVYFGLSDKKRAIHEPNPPTSKSVASAIDQAMSSRTHTLAALSWEMDRTDWTFTDTDLYAFSTKTPEVLSYKNLTTTFGKLIDDVRYGEESCRGKNVEMMLLKNEELPNLEVYANVHVAVGPIHCLLRTFGNGVRKEYSFTIPSIYGDEGDNEFRKEEHQSWYKLPLPITNQPPLIQPSRPPSRAVSESSGKHLGNQISLLLPELLKTIAANLSEYSHAATKLFTTATDSLARLEQQYSSRLVPASLARRNYRAGKPPVRTAIAPAALAQAELPVPQLAVPEFVATESVNRQHSFSSSSKQATPDSSRGVISNPASIMLRSKPVVRSGSSAQTTTFNPSVIVVPSEPLSTLFYHDWMPGPCGCN